MPSCLVYTHFVLTGSTHSSPRNILRLSLQLWLTPVCAMASYLRGGLEGFVESIEGGKVAVHEGHCRRRHFLERGDRYD